MYGVVVRVNFAEDEVYYVTKLPARTHKVGHFQSRLVTCSPRFDSISYDIG